MAKRTYCNKNSIYYMRKFVNKKNVYIFAKSNEDNK